MSEPVSPSPTRWLNPGEDRAWRTWVRMSEMIRARVARDLQECGLSEPDYAVLVCLSEHPDRRVRMSDLAGVLGWSRSRLSHQVGRMEARGQLRKEGCPGDARGWFAALTDAGLDDIRRAAPLHVESVRRAFVDPLSVEQLGQAEAIAGSVIAHLTDLHGGVDDGSGCPGSACPDAG